ncbi:MAG: hypothetical protein RLZZ298_2982 [Pseudomonadota bacterium]|jgi:hypothetical protein
MSSATETGWLYKGVCYAEWSQAQDQLMSYTAPVFTQNPPQMHTFSKELNVWYYKTWNLSGPRPQYIASVPMEYNGFTRCDPTYPQDFQPDVFTYGIATALVMFAIGVGVGLVLNIIRKARTI